MCQRLYPPFSAPFTLADMPSRREMPVRPALPASLSFFFLLVRGSYFAPPLSSPGGPWSNTR